MFRVFIIAEAGVNHNGDVETAKKMIDAAVDAAAVPERGQSKPASAAFTRDAIIILCPNEPVTS